MLRVADEALLSCELSTCMQSRTSSIDRLSALVCMARSEAMRAASFPQPTPTGVLSPPSRQHHAYLLSQQPPAVQPSQLPSTHVSQAATPAHTGALPSAPAARPFFAALPAPNCVASTATTPVLSGRSGVGLRQRGESSQVLGPTDFGSGTLMQELLATGDGLRRGAEGVAPGLLDVDAARGPSVRSTRSTSRAVPRFEHALMRACPEMPEVVLPALQELGSFSRGACLL
ncbi:hypothetical protein DUNSADRAFT_13774 [Dunaliella salina]|uniref:Encoded protein n=1 Tax=Dunaliella salina TaxID=3046 RepID=A0ABQ7G8T7_DUNSA|nr:hypothetical protein DUNSADRAFT_13774 [Dunaliella salina]|eukprot:KAF5830989.1 hypothetical protein DUNSADRAFT_13774 [Dunaliella salina]